MRNILKITTLILLVWFIWAFNIKPFQVNGQINIADILAKEGMCEEAIIVMDNVLPEKTFLDNYARIKYVEIVNNCITRRHLAETRYLAERTVKMLEEATEIRPHFTRTWFLLGHYNNVLTANWSEDRREQAKAALEKALTLSPKRQEIIEELITTHNLLINAHMETMNYPKLAESYSALIDLEPENPENYASLAFVYKELNQTEQAKKTALKIIELFPEHKNEAEAFLQTLE